MNSSRIFVLKLLSFLHWIISKGEMSQSNNNHAFFATITFYTVAGFDVEETIVEFHHMECCLSSMRHVCYITSRTEIYLWTSLSIGFEVIYKNPSQASACFQHHAFYILFNANSSCTQLMVLSNWSKIATIVFLYITSYFECISKFLNAQRKCLELRKPFVLSSSLNFWCCKLWFES